MARYYCKMAIQDRKIALDYDSITSKDLKLLIKLFEDGGTRYYGTRSFKKFIKETKGLHNKGDLIDVLDVSFEDVPLYITNTNDGLWATWRLKIGK